MDSTLIVFGSIALGAFSILCISLVVVAFRAAKNIDRITATLGEIGTDITELKSQALPMIGEATSVLQRADTTLVKLDGAVDQLAAGTSAIRGIADDARALEQQVVDRLRPSIDDLTGLLAGSVKGVTSFVRSLLDR